MIALFLNCIGTTITICKTLSADILLYAVLLSIAYTVQCDTVLYCTILLLYYIKIYCSIVNVNYIKYSLYAAVLD